MPGSELPWGSIVYWYPRYWIYPLLKRGWISLPHPFYAPYTHLMPSVSQDTGLRWSKLLPVIKDAIAQSYQIHFSLPPWIQQSLFSIIFCRTNMSGPLGELVKCRSTGPIIWASNFWRAVPENLHCNELTSQFSCTWLYRFKYSKGLGLDQCTSVFPASSHRRNMFTFCSYTHILRICQVKQKFHQTLLLMYAALWNFYPVFYFFQRLIIAH